MAGLGDIGEKNTKFPGRKQKRGNLKLACLETSNWLNAQTLGSRRARADLRRRAGRWSARDTLRGVAWPLLFGAARSPAAIRKCAWMKLPEQRQQCL
jgi:hypothetical protein